ncbi:hypothetical protein F750_5384 [Streptomyces sp. PAMC 26508]|nr:hypothetical protein F750_5384 [Streptomyces sp. PAMC 26508]
MVATPDFAVRAALQGPGSSWLIDSSAPQSARDVTGGCGAVEGGAGGALTVGVGLGCPEVEGDGDTDSLGDSPEAAEDGAVQHGGGDMDGSGTARPRCDRGGYAAGGIGTVVPMAAARR